MIIKREIQKNIEKNLFKRKIIVLYGARQVGKTTLVKEILKNFPQQAEYYSCDEIDIRQSLTDKTSTELKSFFGKHKLVVIDEAQRVKNIGLTLKLLADNFSDLQVIATGSSSFDLSSEIAEPLTGRKIEFYLYPFSLAEINEIYSVIEIKRLLEKRMIYGMYPEIVLDEESAERNLKNLTSSYTYKDILQYQNIKNPEALERLLQALALQIGNEVSYNELASLVRIDKNTIANYISILEKAFIVFRLRPFSRNLRSELKKLRKIYFYDTGIRNALINNLNPLNIRQDTGGLWENFFISERMKHNNNRNISKNVYFWRTRDGQEIDYIEEENGKMDSFEIKWKSEKFKQPKDFLKHYKNSQINLVNKDNFEKYI